MLSGFHFRGYDGAMNLMSVRLAPWFIWVKAIIILGSVFLLSVLVPSHPLDPWGLVNLNKFFKLIGALLLIQVSGVLLVKLLGQRHGLLLTGFLGGIVSSTALTVSLARQHAGSTQKVPAELLPFLSATLAMLCEALLFVYLGASEFHWQLGLIFLGPILFTLIAIGFLLRRNLSFALHVENGKIIDLLGTLKLVIFIMGILGLSKIVQNFAGHTGLQALTFLVSLFEIHGSVISNTQLHEAGDLTVVALGTLLGISILASYVSKFFLIAMLGSAHFKKYAGNVTAGVTAVLVLSYLLFRFLI